MWLALHTREFQVWSKIGISFSALEYSSCPDLEMKTELINSPYSV